MSRFNLVSSFDIQLFAEGGDGGTGAGNAGAETAAAPQPQQGVKAPLSAVQYGKQDEEVPAAGEQQQTPPETDTDRSARFEAMIKGEFKDLYDRRVQDTIRRRLSGSEEAVNRDKQFAEVRMTLADKYGVDANDPQAILKALDEDDSFFEKEAQESGLSVQQIKANRKIQRENAALKEQIAQINTKQRADELLASWQQQSEALKQIYPSFDLQTELQNPQFRSLLQSNVPIQTAFEVLHKDEIIPAAMQYTAQQVKQQVTNSVRAGQMRPTEGAMGSPGPVQRKSDVSQLTKADIEEINRRVARGERISF